LLPQVLAQDAGALDLLLVRIKLRLDEGPRGVDDHPLFFVEPEIHRLTPSSGRWRGPRLPAAAARHGPRPPPSVSPRPPAPPPRSCPPSCPRAGRAARWWRRSPRPA